MLVALLMRAALFPRPLPAPPLPPTPPPLCDMSSACERFFVSTIFAWSVSICLYWAAYVCRSCSSSIRAYSSDVCRRLLMKLLSKRTTSARFSMVA